MTVKEKLSADMKEAMRAKDKKKVSVIRMLLSELQYEQTSAGSDGSPIDDAVAIRVVTRYHKRLTKALADFPEGEKQDEVKFELSIVEAYLPKKASEEEIRKVAERILSENEGAHFGVVMKACLAELGDAGDGALVSKVIKSLQS